MHRFYCSELAADLPAAILSDHLLQLDDDEARHAKSVLRLKPGQAILLFNGRGASAPAEVVQADRHLRVRVGPVTQTPRLTPTLTIAVAAPKGGRLEDMVNQLSQLGVDRVQLLRTSRGVVEPGENKQRRLQRTAIESAKQSGRAWLMEVADALPLAAVLDEPCELTLLAQPGAPVLGDLAHRLTACAGVRVLIGPEGGFSDEELALARGRGAIDWSLGPHILRIETAATAAAAVLRYLRQ